MPEGRTSTFNPATGERQETTFQYEPMRERVGMETINPAAVMQMFQEQKIADAEKALAAAIQFQGLRAYQNAIKRGVAMEKALADNASMMFFNKNPVASAGLHRAMLPKPPPIVPQITPYQRESLDLQKKRLDRPPTVSETVKQVPNPSFFPGMTNVPPMISTTNRTTRGIPSTASSQAPAKLSEQVAQPEAVEIIIMTNPKGQRVRVPQTDVERAKKLGYK